MTGKFSVKSWPSTVSVSFAVRSSVAGFSPNLFSLWTYRPNPTSLFHSTPMQACKASQFALSMSFFRGTAQGNKQRYLRENRNLFFFFFLTLKINNNKSWLLKFSGSILVDFLLKSLSRTTSATSNPQCTLLHTKHLLVQTSDHVIKAHQNKLRLFRFYWKVNSPSNVQ